MKMQVFQDVKWHCWVCSGQHDPDSEGTMILQNISNQLNDKSVNILKDLNLQQHCCRYLISSKYFILCHQHQTALKTIQPLINVYGNTTASKSSEGDRGTKLTIHCKDEYVSFTSMLSAKIWTMNSIKYIQRSSPPA
jgi:DNA-directed RNA polymerase subunit N (RpoN/RPB10)